MTTMSSAHATCHPAPTAPRRRWAVQMLLAAALAGAGTADSLGHSPAFVPHVRLADPEGRGGMRSTQGFGGRIQAAGRGALGLRASMRDYRSRIASKESTLEKLSRQVFNLQDTLLQMKIIREAQADEQAPAPPEPNPQKTVVVGTGPAGLATAMMLARRGWTNIVLYDRLPAPPRSDSGEWGDPERSYNIGMDAKGQGLLQDIAAWDRVAPHCAEVVGRVDWVPGSDEPQEVDFIDKFGYSIQVIQRDCLTALLREEIEDKYQDKIRLVYNTECKAITWGARPGDPVRLEMQETRRVHPKGEARGTRPTVEAIGAPTITMADFVVGADGANSRVRDAMEADAEPEEGFKVVRYPDLNKRVFKTISLNVPEGERINVDYSAVSLEDIIIDALPLQDGKMIGVVLFRPDDTRVADAKTPEQVKEMFANYLPMFMPFITEEAYAAFGAKREQSLPAFQYCGPVVHRRDNTVLLGDAIHTVKPFFGFGINTALDDIKWLDHCLDAQPSSRAEALKMFSQVRGTEAVSIVEISQELDQPGIKGLLAFFGPLILDSIFEKIMPGVFHPNLLIYCRKDGVTFTDARRRKKRDLKLQLSFIGAQFLWGSTAAKIYAGERCAAPLLAAAGALAEKTAAFVSSVPLLPINTPIMHAVTSVLDWTWMSV